MPFHHVRAAYERLREQERLQLQEYLQKYFAKDKKAKAAGLTVVTGSAAGKGAVNFKPSDEGPAFDLRNWKWIQVTGKEGFNCIVSLNLPSIAPDTGLPVACYDRIGLLLLAEPKEWFDTKITLPLSARKRKMIAQYVVDQI